MGVAEGAGDGRASHADGIVRGVVDVFASDGLPEARPAGTGFEFGFGAEEGDVAADAAEDAVFVKIPGGAGVGTLGAGAAGDFVGDGRELRLPLGFGFDEMLREERMSALFGFPVRINQRDGYYHMW